MSGVIKLGCFASGRGSNFEALIRRAESGDLSAEIRFLITNNSHAGAAAIAREHNIPVYHISGLTHPDPEEYTKAMVQLVQREQIDLIVLCGYMKSLPDRVIQTPRWGGVNIHPSLLPKYGGHGFYGEKVHCAVLEGGEKETGVTVHRVDTVYDTGEVLEQRRVPVIPGDTPERLAARVLLQEHDLYWRVIQQFADGQRGVPFLSASQGGNAP